MKAVVQSCLGAADTLSLGDMPIPEPGPGQLRLRVRAAGVNRADVMQREGHYPPPPGASAILGLEVAGEIDAIGAGVTGFVPGERIAALVSGGGYAEFALVSASLAMRLPAGMGFVEAASLPEAWMTAWLNLRELGDLHVGQRVLIHAGASGVGAAAIQLARLSGATVLTTAGSDEKCAFCESLGASLAINYRTTDVAGAVRAAGKVDLILDPVGGATLGPNLACLNQDGKLVLIAFMAGRSTELDLGQLLMKRLTVIGSTLRNRDPVTKARLAARVQDTVIPAIVAGDVRATVDRTFPLAEVAAAHRYLESNQNRGKVVLTVAAASTV